MEILNKPVRIQRKRTKGWKMPMNTVYVGRPTKWGNAATKKNYSEDPKKLIEYYQSWLRTMRMNGTPIDYQIKSELKGKNLACWCPLDQPCHADVLLKIANQP